MKKSSVQVFDIFLYVGALLLTVVIILVLFTLKWKQNAQNAAANMTSETYDGSYNTNADSSVASESGAVSDTGDVDGADGMASADGEIVIEEPPKGIVIDDDDVIYFLGGDFSLIQQRFASSEQILGTENHYFVDEYLGVVYDEVTHEVMCLDNDGPGKMPIKLAGLHIGMDSEEFYRLLSESEIEYTQTEDGLIRFNWHADGDIKYRADIEFEDDKIIDIICRIR